MIMEEEVKSLIKDIKYMEEKVDVLIERMRATTDSTIRDLCRQQVEGLEQRIIRKMEILRIISKD